jgi:hemerythrin-like metal-binding protein
MTGASGGTSSANSKDFPAYLRDLLPRSKSAGEPAHAQPRREVRIVRDEILDGRSRIVGYRFRAVASGEGEAQPAPLDKLNALKEDRLASFAQHRMAVVPISADEWRTLDYQQFAGPNTIFHVALPHDGRTAAWLRTLEDVKRSGAAVALDGAALESSFADAADFASLMFVRPADYAEGGIARLLDDLRLRGSGAHLAVDGVRSWRDYRAYLDMGAEYCLGEFTATPYERDEVHERTVVESVLNCRLVQFSWYRVFECGHEEIDRDHRALFALANDLLNGIIAGRPAGKMYETVDELLRMAAAHFVHEEAALRIVGYPRTDEHAVLHRSLSDKAAALVADFKAGKAEIGAVFQFLAEDLIVKHMLGADREFFPMFAKQGKAAAAAV